MSSNPAFTIGLTVMALTPLLQTMSQYKVGLMHPVGRIHPPAGGIFSPF